MFPYLSENLVRELFFIEQRGENLYLRVTCMLQVTAVQVTDSVNIILNQRVQIAVWLHSSTWVSCVLLHEVL